MAARKKATKQAAPTAYVILQKWGPDADGLVNWIVVRAEGEEGPILFEAASKSAAIRQHTGTGEDIKPGTWKAIPWSSWKGGETTRTKVTAERLPFEEGV
jgi:hypothetical protein